jgi:hypothetical protein
MCPNCKFNYSSIYLLVYCPRPTRSTTTVIKWIPGRTWISSYPGGCCCSHVRLRKIFLMMMTLVCCCSACCCTPHKIPHGFSIFTLCRQKFISAHIIVKSKNSSRCCCRVYASESLSLLTPKRCF